MRTLGILLAVIVVGIVAYKLAYPTTVYRFRITVNVDTPRGLKTGSSVLEVRHRSYPAWTTLGNNTGESRLTGEAVFVDLGSNPDGRRLNVVALLANGPRAEGVDFYLVPGMAFAPHWKGESKRFITSREVSKLPVGTRAELQGNLIPTLVSFSDPSDPNTARVVSASDFGSGTRLRNVEIEIVSPGNWPLTLIGFSGEPMTRELEKNLTWISHVTGYLNGQFSCNPSAESCLDVGHFRRRSR
jgi:hypothetical protein